MRPIITILTGSHLYGTNIEGSDHDYKVVYIPSPRSILLGEDTDLENASRAKDDIGESLAELHGGAKIDVEFLDLQKFVEMLCQGQTNATDMLFAPASFYVGSPSAEWYTLTNNREKFISRNCKAFVGYCRAQVRKFVVKQERFEALESIVSYLERFEDARFRRLLEATVAEGFSSNVPSHTLIDISLETGAKITHLNVCETRVPLTATIKEARRIYRRQRDRYGERVRNNSAADNKDWKSMYHAVRVAYEAIELLTTGELKFPRPERRVLLEIRQGEYSLEIVQNLIEKGLRRVEEAVMASTLPEEPDLQFAESLVEELYRSEVVCDNP